MISSRLLPIYVKRVSIEIWIIMKPGQNGRYFADDIFMYILLNVNFYEIKFRIFTQNFVTEGSIDNTSVLVQVMAWQKLSDKASSVSMFN